MKKAVNSRLLFGVAGLFVGLLLFSDRALNGLKRSAWFAPYKGNKTAFRYAYKKSGVYLIKKNNRVVYVGFSRSNLYKTMARHFQRWRHPYQDVVTYSANDPGIKVRILFCSPSQALRLEKYLIQKLKPADNIRSKDIETALTVVSENDPIVELMRNAEPLPF